MLAQCCTLGMAKRILEVHGTLQCSRHCDSSACGTIFNSYLSYDTSLRTCEKFLKLLEILSQSSSDHVHFRNEHLCFC
jgi:hypothetical protein